MLGRKALDEIEAVLQQDLSNVGVDCIFLIDMAGNVIANLDNGEIKHDIYSLAALAAGNFAAVSTMARIIGEDEFSLLFHKGERESMHFSKSTSRSRWHVGPRSRVAGWTSLSEVRNCWRQAESAAC